MAGTSAVLGVTDAVVALVALRVADGFGHSGISQSRQLVVARSVEIGLRGRVNSWICGTHRLMFVTGPLLGGFVYSRWGEGAAFSLAGGLTALGLADGCRPRVPMPCRLRRPGIGIGIGSGLSSGTMLTLGTDLAPPEEPGPFVAGFQTVSAAGSFSGPLLVGWVADIYGLRTAALALAVTLADGAVWIALVIGETRTRDT
jgi:MFS family permease